VKTRQQRPKQKKTESTPNSSSDAIAASTEAFAGTEENATTSAYSNLIVLLDALMKCTQDTPLEDVSPEAAMGSTYPQKGQNGPKSSTLLKNINFQAHNLIF
jgi:ABC-type molybdenum transport system ATPase subunit/photorepair protein PhrA